MIILCILIPSSDVPIPSWGVDDVNGYSENSPSNVLVIATWIDS
jgi:hypothetical protein